MMFGRYAMVLVSGALFGFGLSVSSMVRPESVLAFLRLTDPGLLLVLGSAVSVALAAYQWAPRLLRQPLLGGAFRAHRLEPSGRAIIGAAIFGVGWGLCGVCPGPAVAGLGAGNWPVLAALAGIFAGAWVHGRLFERDDFARGEHSSVSTVPTRSAEASPGGC